MATFEQEIIIGIDLGTTYSCVAAYDPKVKGVVVLPNSLGARTTPSWVAFTEEGRVVGEPAKQQASMNVANTIFDIKRIIGRSFSDDITVKETEKLPFKITDGGNDRPVVQVSWKGEDKELSPEEISSMVLLEMKRAAEAALGADCKKAVVTVPAHFNDQQRQATKDAGRIAGLDIVRIINEPTAAALAYGLHSTNADGSAPADKANVMIFDLGGGTFDVSVLSMENGVFAVKSTGGDTHLGGEDFDVALLKWAKSKILASHGQAALDKLEASERGLQRLRRACEVTKCNLSNEQKSDLEVDSLLDGETFSATITRDEFNALSKGLVDTCMDTVRQVIKDAKINNEQVSDVVLVGGSTRIPLIQEQLVEFFDGRISLCKSINPDEAVAHGAAVQAAIMMSGATGGGQALEGICTDIVLLDVAPLSLGIELEGSMMSVLIPRNTAIPCVKCREYTTVEDWQTTLDIVVYEGERPHTSANNKLGEFKVTGIERAKRGEPKIEVTFQMDSNGILHVTARDRVTGANATAEIKADRGRLTEDDIEKMISDAEKHRAEDEALSRKINLKNALEETIYSVKSEMVEKNDIDGISRLEDLLEWVENDAATASMTAIESKCVDVKKKFGITVQPKRSD